MDSCPRNCDVGTSRYVEGVRVPAYPFSGGVINCDVGQGKILAAANAKDVDWPVQYMYAINARVDEAMGCEELGLLPPATGSLSVPVEVPIAVQSRVRITLDGDIGS